jgi:hypothetical protein
MSLIFRLTNHDGAGFFCQLWKLTSNYLYAKKHQLDFYVDDANWLFRHTQGWRDYFSSLKVLSEHPNVKEPIMEAIHDNNTLMHQFTLQDYMNACTEIYTFTDELNDIYRMHLSALPEVYHSIMIRRGDKMCSESQYMETYQYVDTLLERGHHDIFVQTDDYTAYEEVLQYITDKNINIHVITTCPPHKRGAFVSEYPQGTPCSEHELNKSYLSTISNTPQKTVRSYSPIEMKEHVEEMIVGLKICMNSEYLATDFQSNVTRYLLCGHKQPNHVISIYSSLLPEYTIPIKCPVHGFVPYTT